MIKHSPGSKLKIEQVRSVLRKNGYQRGIYKKTDIQSIVEQKISFSPSFDKYYFYDIAIADDNIEWQKTLADSRSLFRQEHFPPERWDEDYQFVVEAYALCLTPDNQSEQRTEKLNSYLETLSSLTDKYGSVQAAWNNVISVPPQYKKHSKYIAYTLQKWTNLDK